jgi:hypothetical protein
MTNLEREELPSQSQALWLQGFILRQLSIPKLDEEIDETSDIGK